MTMESQAAETLADKIALPPSDWPQLILNLHAQITSKLGSTGCLEWLGLSATGSLARGRLLDYAAGHSLVTEALVHHFTAAVGIDVSEAMVDQYRAEELSPIPVVKKKAQLFCVIATKK
ncbi:hypothetical protein MGG_05821 [Pyricularia oryzae 70-15]|uniref:Methyltransferase domain-containing protein n=1 Tax=Pyricularia oryzae (strain 70-15 / ATCC MYA-4617 / FGSC 8958) TaxID=242507 RepID=G4N3G3_PYRO7|nr:uncharacterized protein MGG_05821 [Pyricularia oryzae 70-15]EHA51841.1 hypothetical protein MGG_05821 [Pyricularia oryzae 70-15]KAI7910314.1 hypothetical protein M9X92_011174 [Pyricularia oryzae]KAI7911095.1 hypothetical protein M0657_011108 [Pyricularia oryzae]